MKKGFVALVLFALLFVPVALAAEYECSDGSEYDEDREEVEIAGVKIMNTIGYSITSSDQVGSSGKISADVLVDAHRVVLTNTSSSQEIEINDELYDISFAELDEAEESVEITIDSSSDIISDQTIEGVAGFEVYVKINDYASGSEEIVVIVADRLIEFTFIDDMFSEIVAIGNDTHAIELLSASDYGEALLRVVSCYDSTITEIVPEVDPIFNETNASVSNSTISNGTNNTIITTGGNGTEVNESESEEILNESVDNTESESLISGGEEESSVDSSGGSPILFYLFIGLGVIVLGTIIWYVIGRGSDGL